ncbi:hypothetical protein ACQ4PT_045233 [Festuca glaucescens]
MDGTNPRYHPRPSAPAAADRSLPNPAPRPERLPPNSASMPDRLAPSRTTPTPDRFLLSPNPSPWSSLSAGQPAKPKPGPTTTPSLPQAPAGSHYSYPHVSSRVTDLKALLHSPSASNAAGAGIDLARPYSTALGGGAAAPPLPKYPMHGLSAGSSVGQQSPLGALFMNKSSNAQGALPGEGSTSGIDGVSQGARQFRDPGVREMHKLASKPPPRHHQPALPGDRILVSCLNVGGEFFMGEAGIFGILCSCHQLRMSVAKFCEHAGGPAEKAGEIVLMENGMSIAYWFKYCVGGLLQSDPEGEHNEQLGFYGQCVNHATVDHSNRVSPEKKCLRSNGWTCARTEGFKGRKGEGCYGSNYKQPRVKSNECSVPQEQIDAWLRINGSKPCIRRQLKGWKHLVVYKSGIHGLGLYTGEFIPRGSLVIEYVGEIVGQRIADKRELEYHSGKRQQYKSVCYFFKIDKEHIIDATRKGGIARFINHSCLPNCVAKIISVRNEKKVVFFSERHINPGEEITYDYHFNQEDEGERIPCFCRSRSCRRYLN